MALPIILAGVAVRYGAKKLAKKLVTRAGKIERKKLAKQKKDDQVRHVIKNPDGTRSANVDKISVKKLYRGAREPDGSYTDPGNKFQRELFNVSIGRRPIGKNPMAKFKNKSFTDADKAFYSGANKTPKDKAINKMLQEYTKKHRSNK